MLYRKSDSVQGTWLKASEIASGTLVKIVSETKPIEGEYGLRNVAKVRVKGAPDSMNANLNKTTINGLIDAFGEDSNSWIDKVLTAYTEKAIVAGKRVTILYLVPEGYQLLEVDGYMNIVRNPGTQTQTITSPSQVRKPIQEEDIPVIEEDEPINPADIPF